MCVCGPQQDIEATGNHSTTQSECRAAPHWPPGRIHRSPWLVWPFRPIRRGGVGAFGPKFLGLGSQCWVKYIGNVCECCWVCFPCSSASTDSIYTTKLVLHQQTHNETCVRIELKIGFPFILVVVVGGGMFVDFVTENIGPPNRFRYWV